MKQLLKELVETTGGSGNEEKIRNLIREKVEDHADSVEVDNLGNLIVRKGSGDKTLMVAAHMDQIGANVQKIDEDGFVHFKKMWGISARELVNQRVKIDTEEGYVTGIIGIKPIHTVEKGEENEIPELEDLVIEIGAEDEEGVKEAGIDVGDYIHIERDFSELQEDYVTGPAFDDRIGCAVLIEALKNFGEEYELAAVFSTQEEVGTKGAEVSAYGINPDVGLAVDVTPCSDSPILENKKYEGELGEGPNIELIQTWGRGMISQENVKDWLTDSAEKNEIEYVKRLGGGNDARSIQMAREGIPTGSIGVPARHIHSPVEVAKMSDIEEAVQLLEAAFSNLTEHF